MDSQMTKANYRQLIGIDHFYCGFSRDEIEDLQKLTSLPFCTYRQVKSGRDQWRGVYWTSTQQHYFEMVESDPSEKFQFGVALSANQIQYCDVRRLQKFFPTLNRALRRLGNKKWFDYLSSKNSADEAYAWAMHYHFLDRPRPIVRKPAPSLIERFTELELVANPTIVKIIRETWSWVPNHMRLKGRVLSLELSHKDRSPFKVKIRLDPEVTHTRFHSITAQLSPFSQRLPRLKHFRLERKAGRVVLQRRL